MFDWCVFPEQDLIRSNPVQVFLLCRASYFLLAFGKTRKTAAHFSGSTLGISSIGRNFIAEAGR